MIIVVDKCPNCGSTAQIRLAYEGMTSTSLSRTYKCGCGASVTIVYKKVETIFRSPSGTKL